MTCHLSWGIIFLFICINKKGICPEIFGALLKILCWIKSYGSNQNQSNEGLKMWNFGPNSLPYSDANTKLFFEGDLEGFFLFPVPLGVKK